MIFISLIRPKGLIRFIVEWDMIDPNKKEKTSNPKCIRDIDEILSHSLRSFEYVDLDICWPIIKIKDFIQNTWCAFDDRFDLYLDLKVSFLLIFILLTP